MGAGVEDFHRRGFLKGLIGAIAGSDLVLRTHPKDLEAFAPVINRPVELWTPTPAVMRSRGVSVGMFLFNEYGERVMVVNSVSVSSPVGALVEVRVAGFAEGSLDFSSFHG